MLQILITLIPVIPLLAATLIGSGVILGHFKNERGEQSVAIISLCSLWLSACALGITGIAALLGKVESHFIVCQWLASDDFRINISFMIDHISLSFSMLISAYSLVVVRFSTNYLHREPGYFRFQLVILLFTASMQGIALAGNAVIMFVGWELAGLCSFLLIAYNLQRTNALINATRVFATNRLGSTGWLLAVFFSYAWTGHGTEWPDLLMASVNLPSPRLLLLSTALLVAAYAKSAQFPFASWLSRSMEGPTPSSALFYGVLMIHAGVFLTLRMRPMIEIQPELMLFIAVMGGITAIYAYACSITQSDVKSCLVFSSLGQTGLMFMACGLGWWEWALCHLIMHACLRGYQFLLAPSYLARFGGVPSINCLPKFIAENNKLYYASLQRFWLEAATDWVLVKPVQAFARDLQRFEAHVIDRIVGLPLPSLSKLSNMAEWEEQHLAVRVAGQDNAAHVSGVPLALLKFLSGIMNWFEYHLVLRGFGTRLWITARRCAHGLSLLEDFLLQPRYLLLLILATLVAID